MSQFDVNDGDKLQFAAEPTATLGDSGLEPWKLLLVDDEKVVHSVTRLALEGFELAGRGLQFPRGIRQGDC